MDKVIKYLKPGRAGYPNEFLNLQPKPNIFVKGELKFTGKKVGIIGTRRPTAYGLRFTGELSKHLALAGVTTVSGLARGIDSAAHKATIDAGGRTIAVLGCGLDVVYPPENKKLYQLVEGNGAIISEYKSGTPPFKHNFPRRNRLISSLSDALIVVEAAEKSGTLITVDYALEQGVDVMVLPGSIYSKQSSGTNNLLKQGAEPITCVEDVLQKVGVSKEISKKQNNYILEILTDEAMSVEKISILTRKTIDLISTEISLLQIEGFVTQDLSGKYYRTC